MSCTHYGAPSQHSSIVEMVNNNHRISIGLHRWVHLIPCWSFPIVCLREPCSWLGVCAWDGSPLSFDLDKLHYWTWVSLIIKLKVLLFSQPREQYSLASYSSGIFPESNWFLVNGLIGGDFFDVSDLVWGGYTINYMARIVWHLEFRSSYQLFERQDCVMTIGIGNISLTIFIKFLLKGVCCK